MAEMKGIKLCGECGNYDWKKHKCKIGCNDDSNAQASFYGDCPLPDVVPKSEVEYMTKEEIVQIIGEADKYCKNTSCTKCKFNEIKTPYCWWHNIAEHIYTAQNTNNFDSRQTIEENKKKYTESEDKE